MTAASGAACRKSSGSRRCARTMRRRRRRNSTCGTASSSASSSRRQRCGGARAAGVRAGAGARVLRFGKETCAVATQVGAVAVTAGAAAVDGLADGTRLTVYALDGKQLQTITAHGGQQTVVSLAGQPAGTYIVKIGDATFKFVKR